MEWFHLAKDEQAKKELLQPLEFKQQLFLWRILFDNFLFFLSDKNIKTVAVPIQ